MTRRNPASLRSRFRGCLLGGAVGDALGALVEFLSLAEIRAAFGPDGIRDFAPAYGQLGAITDDTQTAVFTAEGPGCAARCAACATRQASSTTPIW